VTGFGSNEQLLGFGLAALVIANVFASKGDLDRWFSGAASRARTRRPTSPVRERLGRQAITSASHPVREPA
jgi:hypothetical protein